MIIKEQGLSGIFDVLAKIGKKIVPQKEIVRTGNTWKQEMPTQKVSRFIKR